MAHFKSSALPVAKIAFIVERVRGAYRAGTFHPTYDESLLVDIVAS